MRADPLVSDSLGSERRAHTFAKPKRTLRFRALGLFGLVLAPALLASCASAPTPAKLQAPHSSIFAPPRNAPRWTSNGSVVIPASVSQRGPVALSAAWTYVVAPYPNSIAVGPDGNLRPLWVLYGMHDGTYKDLTPEGITTRGGLVVSAPSAKVVWLGFGSYRYQLYGAVATSTDQGQTWTMHATLPGLFRPTPNNLLASSATQAWALIGLPPDQELVETTDGGTIWKTLVTARQLLGNAAKDCRLRSLGMRQGTLFIGTRCNGDLSPELIEGSGTSFHAVSLGFPPGSPAAKEVTATITTPPGASSPTPTLSILTNQGVIFFELSVHNGSSELPPLELPTGAKVFPGAGSYELVSGPANKLSLYQPRSNHFHGWNLSGLNASALGIDEAGKLVLVGSKAGKPSAWISPTPSGPWTNIVFKPPVTASQIPNAGS